MNSHRFSIRPVLLAFTLIGVGQAAAQTSQGYQYSNFTAISSPVVIPAHAPGEEPGCTGSEAVTLLSSIAPGAKP